jgi:D-glycero-D-manno-heptose 1,7-bisphosphate phosphatase
MPYIILDRDGVINYESQEYIKSPDEWIAIPGSLEAIARLNKAGFKVLVATNQSGVARGYYDLETLDAIHEKLMRELAEVGGYVEEIFFCPHHPEENCECRKPKVGLIQQIKEKYKFDLNQTYFIGDNKTDIELAEAVGCLPILVLTGKGQKTLDEYSELKSVLHFLNLEKAVDFILANKRK